MTPELNSLIEAAVADGTVTDKERDVLRRKAVSIGIDPDEIDMLVDAKLHGARSQAKSTKATKCPQCGAAISGLARVCQDCGHVFEDGGQGATPDLHATLAKLEDLLAELKAIPVPNAMAIFGKIIRGYVKIFMPWTWGKQPAVPSHSDTDQRTACMARLDRERRTIKTYYGDDPKVKRLLGEIHDELKVYSDKIAKAKVITAVIVGIVIAAYISLTVAMGSIRPKEKIAESSQGESESAESLDPLPDGFGGSFVHVDKPGEKVSVSPVGMTSIGICSSSIEFASFKCKGTTCTWKGKRDGGTGSILLDTDGSLSLQTTTPKGGCFDALLSGSFSKKK